MSDIVVSLPRRVIPRWRDFSTTANTGELGATVVRPDLSLPTINLDEVRQRWETFKNPITACELISAALENKDWNALSESCDYIIREETIVPEFTKDFAREALITYKRANSVEDSNVSLAEARLFNPAIINSIRRTLKHHFFSPIHWVDLALCYSIIGRPEKARKAILTALRLAPDDRFVLRCSTRFFLHQQEPDEAKSILSRSPRTKFDPWLLAAHLSVASVLGETSRFHKDARDLLGSDTLHPFQLSELGTEMASIELREGSARQAKKLFNQALTAPTENAFAQALWANKFIEIEKQNHLFNLPRSFEANARANFKAEKWSEALVSSEAWFGDEPFSARPAILGSFIASSAHENFGRAAEIARMGLRANPDEPFLLNNLAFSLAKENNTAEARKVLAKVDPGNLFQESKAINLATSGLIEYRDGNVELGREKYRSAIDYCKSNDLQTTYVRAHIYFAREELRCTGDASSEVVANALNASKASMDPMVNIALARLIQEIKSNHYRLNENTPPSKK